MNTIKFVLRKNDTIDPMIRMTFRHNKDKFVYSTGLHVQEELWDKSKMRVTHKHPRHGIVNSQLNRIEEALVKAYEYYEGQNTKPSNAQLKFKLEEYLNVQKDKNINNAVEITPYIKEYIKKLEKEKVLAKGTIQGYKQLLKRWEKFPKSYGLSFDDLNIAILKDFQSFMLDYGYSQGQREKLQRRLVTILGYAEKADKINVNSDYKLRFWRVGKPENQVKVVMSNDEIIQIRDHNFEKGSTLDRVRDRWMIGFATGQRYSDFKKINIENVREKHGKEYIEVVQQKAGKVIYVPLYDDIKKILDKYDGYPPVFSLQKFNEYIKEVAKEVGIDNTVTKLLQKTDNDVIETTHPKYELVASHICRRSFATNGSLKGWAMAYLMEITGHRKAQTFLEYVNLNKTDLPENMPTGNSLFI